MYEHRSHPLLTRSRFLARVGRHAAAALALIAVSWFAGAVGYRVLENMPWIDATLNAAMMLAGIGPVDALTTTGGKLFASLYGLYSGIVFVGVAALVAAPVAHRLLHRFHLDEEAERMRRR
jgi:hypothetical protein